MPLFAPATGKKPLLGSRLWAFGHSYLQGGGTTHVDRQFVTELGGMLGSDLRDLGVGGSEAANDGNALTGWRGSPFGWGGWTWLLQNVVPSRTGAPYTPGINYLPLIMTGLNDVLNHSHDATGNPRTIFKTALRTMMSRLCASRLFESSDASWTFPVGTWQTKLDTVKNSGVQYKPIPANGAQATWTIPADFEGGTIAIGISCWPASDGQLTFSGSASVIPGPVALAGLAYAANGATGTATRDSSNGHVIRISGLVAADAGKTINATYGSGAGTQFATPAAPGAITNVGTAGATTYTYERVYRTYNGDTIPSATTSTNTGNATLSGTNYNSIPAGPAWPAGVEAELIIRTVGGTSQGIIATLLAGPAVVLDQNPASFGGAYAAVAANPLVGGAAINYAQIESNNPITRGIVCNIAQLPAASIAPYAPVTNADIQNYNADIASVIAEFAPGQWQLADIDSALAANPAYFVNANPHPNDRGHAITAETLENAVGTLGQGIPLRDQSMQSRVANRVVGRSVAVSPISGTLWGTNGVYTLPNNAWGDVDNNNLLVGIDAQIGDDILVTLEGMWPAVNVVGELDICTCNGTAGNVINNFASGSATPSNVGQEGAYFNGSATAVGPFCVEALYTVTAADLVTWFTVPGIVLCKLRGFGAGAGRTLYAGSGGIRLTMHVKKVGPRNTPGFNAS